MSMRLAAAAAVSVSTLLGACASELPETAAADNGDWYCTREFPTGSSIPVNKCRSRTLVRDDQRDADDFSINQPGVQNSYQRGTPGSR